MAIDEKFSAGSRIASWIMDIVLVLLVVPVIAAGTFGIWLAYKVFHPVHRPSKKQPEDFGLAADRVKIPVVGTNLLLDAWVVKHSPASDIVIVCHEWGGHKGGKLHYAKFLHQAGYNVILFDLRNHGESSRDPRMWQMSRRYTDDLEAVIDYAKKNLYPGCNDRKIAIMAFSFSTFPALYLPTTRKNVSISALILDSGPTLGLDALTRDFVNTFLRMAIPKIFRGPILFSVLRTCCTKLTISMLAVSWPPSMADLRAGLLFIGNEQDSIATPENIRALAQLKQDAEVWIVPESQHLLAFRLHGDAYIGRVTAFLRQHLASNAEHGLKMSGVIEF